MMLTEWSLLQRLIEMLTEWSLLQRLIDDAD